MTYRDWGKKGLPTHGPDFPYGLKIAFKYRTINPKVDAT
jgi:hypothetical protein